MRKQKTSLNDALFSKTRQRVLGLLYRLPDDDFHTNEIIRLTHIGTGSVQRELERLNQAELIICKTVGNQKRYQANKEVPFFKELQGIILKTFGLKDILSNALKPILNKDVHFAFIYGSVAKQEDTVKSDVDLMIITDVLSYTDIFPLIEKAEAVLCRPINPTLYALSEWVQKHENNFISQIIKQPKIFIKGTQDELEKLR